MPESAVNRMPAAHNHRDVPPGTAVKYGNGEIETIERLVDIGHYEVQITLDNCSTSLISVDQIVATASHTPAYQTRGNGPSPCKQWKTCPGSAKTIRNAAIDSHRPPRAGCRHSRRVRY